MLDQHNLVITMDPTDHHDIMSPQEDLLTKEELRSKFGILNYVVFIMMLLVSAMIGKENFPWGKSSSIAKYSTSLFFKS